MFEEQENTHPLWWIVAIVGVSSSAFWLPILLESFK